MPTRVSTRVPDTRAPRFPASRFRAPWSATSSANRTRLPCRLAGGGTDGRRIVGGGSFSGETNAYASVNAVAGGASRTRGTDFVSRGGEASPSLERSQIGRRRRRTPPRHRARAIARRFFSGEDFRRELATSRARVSDARRWGRVLDLAWRRAMNRPRASSNSPRLLHPARRCAPPTARTDGRVRRRPPPHAPKCVKIARFACAPATSPALRSTARVNKSHHVVRRRFDMSLTPSRSTGTLVGVSECLDLLVRERGDVSAWNARREERIGPSSDHASASEPPSRRRIIASNALDSISAARSAREGPGRPSKTPRRMSIGAYASAATSRAFASGTDHSSDDAREMSSSNSPSGTRSSVGRALSVDDDDVEVEGEFGRGRLPRCIRGARTSGTRVDGRRLGPSARRRQDRGLGR